MSGFQLFWQSCGGSCLGLGVARQSRILGAGTDEYKRVAAASLWLFGLVAIISYVFRIETARGYVGIALPVGLIGLLLARWLLRQHLSVARQRGASMSRLLLLGGPSAVAHLRLHYTAQNMPATFP